MMKNIRPQFRVQTLTVLAFLIFFGLVTAGYVYGWNLPALAPTGGGGPIYFTSSGNVGIGAGLPAQRLEVAGDVRWSGMLSSGGVPWVRLTGVPGTACATGSLMSGVAGGAVTCSQPACASVQGIPAGFSDCVDNSNPDGIASLSAGFGLTASPSPIPSGGSGSFSVNPTQVQQRVTGTCSGTSVIRAINQDGTVLCATVP